MKNPLIKTEFPILLPTLIYGLYMPMFFILCKKRKGHLNFKMSFPRKSYFFE